MKNFAVIKNNKVVNIIVEVEEEVIAANQNKYIEYTETNAAHIGLGYSNGVFEQPIVVEQPE